MLPASQWSPAWQCWCQLAGYSENRVGMMILLAPFCTVKPVLLICPKLYKIDQIPACTSYLAFFVFVLGTLWYLEREGGASLGWSTFFPKECKWSPSLLTAVELLLCTNCICYNKGTVQERGFTRESFLIYKRIISHLCELNSHKVSWKELPWFPVKINIGKICG